MVFTPTNGSGNTDFPEFISTDYHLKDENEVWDDFLDGKDYAVSYLYRTNIQRLYNYGRHFGAHDVVLDCIQDLFIDLINSRNKLGKTRSVKAYLMASIRRRVLKKNKKQQSELQLMNMQEDQKFRITLIPDSSMIEGLTDAQRLLIKKACNDLPAKQREIILLYYFEELSYPEIMQIMDISKISTARMLVHRALDTLRKNLPQNGIFLTLLTFCLQKS